MAHPLPFNDNAHFGVIVATFAGALNCANVSCHGGQATPNWQSGGERREHPVHELP